MITIDGKVSNLLSFCPEARYITPETEEEVNFFIEENECMTIGIRDEDEMHFFAVPVDCGMKFMERKS